MRASLGISDFRTRSTSRQYHTYRIDSSNWLELVSFQELCSLNNYCAMTLLTSLSAAVLARASASPQTNRGMYGVAFALLPTQAGQSV